MYSLKYIIQLHKPQKNIYHIYHRHYMEIIQEYTVGSKSWHLDSKVVKYISVLYRPLG